MERKSNSHPRGNFGSVVRPSHSRQSDASRCRAPRLHEMTQWGHNPRRESERNKFLGKSLVTSTGHACPDVFQKKFI